MILRLSTTKFRTNSVDDVITLSDITLESLDILYI